MKTLECQICFNEFDDCRRRPRILCCGHTFCSICLSTLITEGKIACPNCKKFHETDDVENININFFLESLLCPDDTSKSVSLDTGYKCKDHFYEQNFFCLTHKEWICRDCTVITHKPCSHSENCSNQNDCRVVTKAERLEMIKSDKLEELQKSDEIYETDLKCLVNEFDNKVKAKLTQREDLKIRLNKFTEVNNIEIQNLRKKLDFTQDVLSNLQEHRTQAIVAQRDLKKVHGRKAVEESCRSIENIIISRQEWALMEKINILEEEKSIADVEITLEEFERLRKKLEDAENILLDVTKENKDLHSKISEQKSTTDCLQAALEVNKCELKDVTKENKDLHSKISDKKSTTDRIQAALEVNKCELKAVTKENKDLRSKMSDQKSTINRLQAALEVNKCELKKNIDINVSNASELKCNEHTIKLNKDRISRLEEELKMSKENCESYSEKILSLQKELETSGKSNGIYTKYGTVITVTELYEIKNHLLNNDGDTYLTTKIFYQSGMIMQGYGKLSLFTSAMQVIILLEAFLGIKPFSPGSLLLKCPPLISKLYSANFIYLDIGKIQFRGKQNECVGIPFGRLYIKLTGCPKQRKQMIQICSAIGGEEWRNIKFSVLRNRDRPGELVTCQCYYRFKDECFAEASTTGLFDELDTSDIEDNPILAGNVFGYLDGSAGFSIITRSNYGRDTKWPLIGKVVSGLDVLIKALQVYDVESIGIHSHGVGFTSE